MEMERVAAGTPRLIRGEGIKIADPFSAVINGYGSVVERREPLWIHGQIMPGKMYLLQDEPIFSDILIESQHLWDLNWLDEEIEVVVPFNNLLLSNGSQ